MGAGTSRAVTQTLPVVMPGGDKASVIP